MAKKTAKKTVKKTVKKSTPKKKTEFKVYDGKDVVRVFKKKEVAEGWAGERGFKVK